MSEVTKLKSVQAVAVTDTLVGEDMVAENATPAYGTLSSDGVATVLTPPANAIGCVIRCNGADSPGGSLRYRMGAVDVTQSVGGFLDAGGSTSFLPYAGRLTLIRATTTSAEYAVDWMTE